VNDKSSNRFDDVWPAGEGNPGKCGTRTASWCSSVPFSPLVVVVANPARMWIRPIRPDLVPGSLLERRGRLCGGSGNPDTHDQPPDRRADRSIAGHTPSLCLATVHDYNEDGVIAHDRTGDEYADGLAV
jgi:hypothetical protein